MPRTKDRKKHRKHTPIVSKSQRGAMGAAYSAKKGKTSVASLWGPARQIYEAMSVEELKRHLKEIGGKKLPKHIRKSRRA